jgi:CHAT domain-containing protein
LTSGNLTKTDALRQAQLKLIRDPNSSHPFFWAPFVLIGNWL